MKREGSTLKSAEYIHDMVVVAMSVIAMVVVKKKEFDSGDDRGGGEWRYSGGGEG